MKIFGRSLEVGILFTKMTDLTRMFFKSLLFNEVGPLWAAYIKKTNPKENKFTTRDGYQILLSNNLHDSITVMVIFCRMEYGKIEPGSTVIDVGANIGVFSLYAARCNAKRVYAFEPNKESYEVLIKNIKVNNLENIIIPFNLAVGPLDGELISIPKNSSPYNKTFQSKTGEHDYDIVETISLPSFISKYEIDKIDFLKMDCEGAEYSIIYSMSEENFKLITTFRLEDHIPEEKEKLVKFFINQGFQKTRDNGISVMWFDRPIHN